MPNDITERRQRANPADGDDTVKSIDLLDEDVVDVASLRAGMRLAQDVFDDSNVLLLASGMQVTPRFLHLLGQRRIKTVRLRSSAPVEVAEVRADDWAREAVARRENEHSRRLDELLARETQTAPRLRPVPAWRRPRLPIEALKAEALRGLERHAAVGGLVANVGETLQLGGKVSAGHLGAALRNFVNMVSLDFDLLPLIVSMQRTKDEYLFDHAVNVALLSITIGAQLGLAHHQLMEIGLGALVHDVGMLRVPGQIRLAPRELTSSEMEVVRRHPLHTVDLLVGVRGLPTVARIIAYQVHERCDGTGYPRGHHGAMLHPFATIVSVADAYAARTRPRPYRDAISPYEAAKAVLYDAATNKFDRTVVRAFLDAVALFPVGSIVELADGRSAVVVRANPTLHTKPVIEVLSTQGKPTGTVVDLAKEASVAVVHAHPTSNNVFVEYADLSAPPPRLGQENAR